MLRLSDEELPGGPRPAPSAPLRPEAAAARLQAIAADFERYHQDLHQRVAALLGRTHLGRDLEVQPAQVALAANLKHPDYVQVVCGTLDRLPRALAELDRQEAIGPPRLQRTNRNARLRRRNRAWANDARQEMQPLDPATPALNPSPSTAR